MEDDSDYTNRDRKVAGREKARRFAGAGRAYLHAVTSSRVRRAADAIRRSEQRNPAEPNSNEALESEAGDP